MNPLPAMPEVVCTGIIVADHICTPIDHVPVAGELVITQGIKLAIGGCAANTSVDLAKLGIATSIVGRVGNDIYGSLICTMLSEASVNTDHVISTENIETSQTLIVLVQGQDRRFVHSFGANACLTSRDLVMDQFPTAKVLYIGGYLLMPALEATGLVEVLQSARRAGIRTVLDVGIPGPGAYRANLEKVLPWVDVFLPNDDEGHLILDEADPFQQAIQFKQMGAKTVVITRGSRGSILISDEVRLQAGVFPVEYVDGSGSGDAFDAGYILGLIQQQDHATCLTMASALGASCVRAIGTTPGVFNRAELTEFLQHHHLPVTRW